MSTAVLICYEFGLRTFGPRSIEQTSVSYTWWDSLAEALEASELGCGPRCRNDHLIVYSDVYGQTRVMQAAKPETTP